MASKLLKASLGLVLGLTLSGMVMGTGILLGATIPAIGELPMLRSISALLPATDPADPAAPPATSETAGEPEALFDPFWEAWDIFHEQYVDQPLDDETLMRGAIEGMIDALGDPQSGYMDPQQYRQANIPLEGEYEGIGAWVDPDAEYLTIISPMPGSPAERAGLLPGDMIIAIDGDDMTGIDGDLVIRRVLGPAGSKVVLTIHRPEPFATFDVEVTRASITVPSLESRTLEGGIAYVRLFSFADQTDEDLRRTLEQLITDETVGLILDLRGNGGGFLGTSVDVASEFIEEGVILIERFGDGQEEIYRASGRGLATTIPLVVLIDGGSASASEIVAGAIQDHARGYLVGETTFGKGSVQNWVPLSNEQGAVRVTIARWFTPNNRQIQDVGLFPDYEVTFSDEDIEAGIDVQLERAIELLLP